MDHSQPPHDHNVRLLKNDTLGSGSYGVVYKAMYGQRLCAAKILHPIFFQSNDPGIMTTIRRFEQECYFLNDMKHPHIVEYLGTSHDPDSGLLVLLIELMDESLTHFLERSQQPLAYHIEIDLCHDIAQALAYIHSKEIIHRDLSSNNVLLIAGRAKITDFGMSKLLDANRRMAPFTMCPGTLVYMPPEALREPPVYSKKIDCFSFGVLQIQIMTRQFPDPGPAMLVVEDSRSPTGTTNMPVLDSKRRKSHVDLIDHTHTLLPTALDCLSYLEKDRPSAQDLCQRLAAIKETPRYQLQTLQHELHTKDQQLRDCQRCVLTLEQELRDSQRQIQQLTHQVEEKQLATEERERQVRELTEQLQTMKGLGALPQKTAMQQKAIQDMRWQKASNAPEKVYRGSAASDVDVVYFNSNGSTSIHSYDSDARVRHRLPRTPHTHFTLVVIEHLLTIVGGQLRSGEATDSLLSFMGEGRDKKWQTNLPAIPTKRYWAAVVCSGHSLIVAGGRDDRNTLATVEVLDTDARQWSLASSLTHPFHLATLSICGEMLYMMGGYDQTDHCRHSVLRCSIPELLQSCQPQPLAGKLRKSPAKQSTVWQHVANAPHYLSSCATLCGRLVAIGGLQAGEHTRGITIYNERTNSWEAMGDMPTARYQALVAILNGKMMVFGGRVVGGWVDISGMVGGWVRGLFGVATNVVEILC